MKRVTVLLLLLVCCSCGILYGQDKEKKRMSTRRMECSVSEKSVSSGTEVFFAATPFMDDSPAWGETVNYTLYSGIYQPVEEGSFVFTPETRGFWKRLDTAGYVQCRFLLPEREGMSAIRGCVGVLIDAEKLRPVMPVPQDFDEFWAKQIATMRSEKMEVTWGEEHSASRIRTRTFRATAGKQAISGELFLPPKPENAEIPEKYPIIMYFHGGGVRSAGFSRTAALASRGYAVLEFTPHGLEMQREPKFYYDKFTEEPAGELFEYYRRGTFGGAPEEAYLCQIALRTVMLADLATSLDCWDGKNLFATGGSQGGFSSLAVSALHPRVTAVAVWIPAGNDMVRGTWPCLGPQERELPHIEDYKRILPYFDTSSFCSRIKIPVVFYPTIADPVVNPAGVACGYNMIPAETEKEIHWLNQMTHEDNPMVLDACEEFLEQHLRR